MNAYIVHSFEMCVDENKIRKQMGHFAVYFSRIHTTITTLVVSHTHCAHAQKAPHELTPIALPPQTHPDTSNSGWNSNAKDTHTERKSQRERERTYICGVHMDEDKDDIEKTRDILRIAEKSHYNAPLLFAYKLVHKFYMNT